METDGNIFGTSILTALFTNIRLHQLNNDFFIVRTNIEAIL